MKTVRPAKGKAIRAGGKPAIAKPARRQTNADVPVQHRSSKTPQPQSGTTLYIKPKPSF
jgi:hypothetical protein